MLRIEDMVARISDQIVLLQTSQLKAGPSPRLDGINATHVRYLAALEQELLPPLVVHREEMRVVDGAHRLEVARSRGLERVPVVYFDGTQEEAFIVAVHLNAVHGKALRARDRVAAVRRILDSHPHWSDRWIASACGVAPRTVAEVRRASADDGQRLTTRIGRDGRCRPLSAQDGRREAEQIMREEPEASLRQVARRAGISVGTALDVRRRLLAASPSTMMSPAVGAAVRAAQRWGAPPTVQPTVLTVRDQLDWLAREPSLRYTDRGRALLRLISATLAFLDDSGPLVGPFPGHCHYSLDAVARACAGSWLEFAEQLEFTAQAGALVPHEAAAA